MRHLDGRVLRVLLPPRETIQPGTFKMVPNAGMPIPGTGGMRFGDLYIKFNVVLPPAGALTPAAVGALRAALPRALDRHHTAAARRAREEGGDAARGGGGGAGGDDAANADADPNTPDAEEVSLDDVSVEVRRARVQAQAEAARHASSSEAYDSDGEDGGRGGAQRVQCAQQ